MSLVSSIVLLAQRIGAEFKDVRIALGGLDNRVDVLETAPSRTPLNKGATSGTVSFNCDGQSIFDITLNGNATFNFTGAVDGQKIELRVKQDGTGSRLWTPGAMVRFSADLPVFTLSVGANKLDRIGLEYHAADSKYDVLSYNRGY